MAELSPEALQAILDKLDDVCRQAQELQRQIREQMLERARRDRPARSAAAVVRSRAARKPSRSK